MDQSFSSLDAEKQNRIKNAAFIEFSIKGYKNASTNQIAKQAGIGKGTLFYYFGNKEKLYHYLIDDAFDIAYDYFLSQIDFHETDFFNRLEQSSTLKWEVYLNYSEALSFMSHVFLNVDENHLPDYLKEKRIQAEKLWGDILTKNIDFSKFRSDIPQDTSFNFIRWTIEGYRSELELRFKKDQIGEYTKETLKPYFEEFNNYLNTLRKIYYK